MNWEESKALTPLKRDFLKAFFDSTDAFFLTGGSALGVFYLQHRLSFDLDFFTTDESLDWHVLDNELQAISRAMSASISSVTSSPTFRRYELTRNSEREVLDFVIEFAPQIDREKNSIGNLRVDTLREIMVNKICTLIGRCEVKDVVDLFFLEKRGFRVAEYFEEAKQKEGGLDPAMLSYILSEFQLDRVPDYLLEPLSVEELRAYAASLQQIFAGMAYPED